MKIIKANTPLKGVVIPDIHFDYHNSKAVSLALEVIAKFKPDFIVFIGDLLNLDAVSRFKKNPNRILTLKEEFSLAKNFFHDICNVSKRSDKHLLAGNHEERLRDYLWTKAPELSVFDELTVEHLLDLEKYGIVYHEEPIIINDVMFRHGNYTTISSTTQELMHNLITGFSGHTHKVESIWKSFYGKTIAWHSCGCLCDIPRISKQYMKGKVPNWQNCVTRVFIQDGKAHPIHHIIEDGSTVYDGVVIHG